VKQRLPRMLYFFLMLGMSYACMHECMHACVRVFCSKETVYERAKEKVGCQQSVACSARYLVKRGDLGAAPETGDLGAAPRRGELMPEVRRWRFLGSNSLVCAQNYPSTTQQKALHPDTHFAHQTKTGFRIFLLTAIAHG
jgi:hypothetical protein